MKNLVLVVCLLSLFGCNKKEGVIVYVTVCPWKGESFNAFTCRALSTAKYGNGLWLDANNRALTEHLSVQILSETKLVFGQDKMVIANTVSKSVFVVSLVRDDMQIAHAYVTGVWVANFTESERDTLPGQPTCGDVSRPGSDPLVLRVKKPRVEHKKDSVLTKELSIIDAPVLWDTVPGDTFP